MRVRVTIIQTLHNSDQSTTRNRANYPIRMLDVLKGQDEVWTQNLFSSLASPDERVKQILIYCDQIEMKVESYRKKGWPSQMSCPNYMSKISKTIRVEHLLGVKCLFLLWRYSTNWKSQNFNPFYVDFSKTIQHSGARWGECRWEWQSTERHQLQWRL